MDNLLSLLEESDAQARQGTYAEVVLPLALHKRYTYAVPFHLKSKLEVGMRVEVQFGKKSLYAGVVWRIHQNEPPHKTKPIIALLDEYPIVTDKQMQLWLWLADYYAANLGDVMHAALPAGLKLNSETRIVLRGDFDKEALDEASPTLDGPMYTALQALLHTPEMNAEDLRRILQRKTIHPLIQKLIKSGYVFTREELRSKYKPKLVKFVRLAPYYAEDTQRLTEAFNQINSRATRQMETLMAFLQMVRNQPKITLKALHDKAQSTAAVTNKLKEKGILEIYEKEVSRLDAYEEETIANFTLAPQQIQALQEIETHFESKSVVLLHGVTGSGKTQIFVELMEKALETGRQTLYLLPEIALTAQIVVRLQKHFGDQIAVYHSKFNHNERVEIWHKVLEGVPIILGARSALFLPFQDLELIIVDEEHDPSYKQNDPAPRYNARDTAVYLAHMYKAKVLLGTATPSLETIQNVRQGKYAKVELTERFGGLQLPEIQLVNAAKAARERRMKGPFTDELLEAIQKTLAQGEQVILFQNRRGYVPTLQCKSCGWTAECIHCDVSLTYHKFAHNLRCHYCGYGMNMPKACPACGDPKLNTKGFGTEKIEEELALHLKEAKIARMDWDTVRGKGGHEKIIRRFASGKVNVLVGTQMVTKGLDFDNVGLVGVLSADHILHFPDFRAAERAYQLLTQVSGRAGRKKKRGKVLIQAFDINHAVLAEVQNNNFKDFIQRELHERNEFAYPPFQRLIQIQLKHRQIETVEEAAQFMAEKLKLSLGDRVLGPAVPGVSRVRGYYLRDILIKLNPKYKKLQAAKTQIKDVEEMLKQKKGLSTVRVAIDVDPY